MSPASVAQGTVSQADLDLERRVKTPVELNDDAIVVAGLAETLQRRLDEAHNGNDIDDALNLAWAFAALAQLAQLLSDRIGDYAG
jgi:hypothetical protein